MALYRVTINGRVSSKNTANVIAVSSNQVPSPALSLAIANQVLSAWTTNILPVLHTSYQVASVDVQNLNDPLDGALVAGTASTGAKTGDALPLFVTAKVRWTTGLRGWAAKGRTGLGPLAESQVNGNQLLANERTIIIDAVTAFRAGLSNQPTGVAQVVASTIVDGAPRPAPISAVVNGFSVALAPGSQVSRKIR